MKPSPLFAAAIAALVVSLPAAAQGKGDIRIAHVYGKTGPLEAYAQADPDRPDDGPRVRDRRQDEGRRPQDRRHREGRPEQARRRQERCWPPPTATTRSTSPSGPTSSGVGAGDAAGGRGVQEDPAGRAGGRRLDHRRQVEPLHLPHRPQLDRRTRSRTRSRSASRRHLDRDARPGLRLRPRRRRRRSRRRSKERRKIVARGIRCRRRPPTSPPARSACSTR